MGEAGRGEESPGCGDAEGEDADTDRSEVEQQDADFRPIQDDNGELEGIAGSYSRQQYTDAIFIFDRTNVSAARVLDDSYGGGCVWSKEEADLQEVVQELLALPEPGQRLAPTLVKRSSLLWTP